MMRLSGDFHKLINTCVENFTVQKYIFRISASSLLYERSTRFDHSEIRMLQYDFGWRT